MRKRADADRERERALEPAAPRLQIGIAQPREPRVARRQLVDLLEEPERDDERREGVRDRRVAPVEQPQAVALRVDVLPVEIVGPDRPRHVVRGRLAPKLPRTRRQTPYPTRPGP